MREFLAQHQAKLSTLAFLTLGGAFILSLIVNLGTPIIGGVFVANVVPANGTKPLHELRWGVWGACVTGPYNATQFLYNTPCTDKMLGYATPEEYYTVIGATTDLAAAPTQGLEILWLMHPINTALLFSMIPLSLFIHTRDITIASVLIGVLAAGAGTFAFASDIAFAIVAQQKVHTLTQGEFKVNFGPAVWIQFVAFLFGWGALIQVTANCFFGVRKFKG